MSHKVAILDAGAQYGKVIDRRVRELKVESDILPLSTPAKKLKEYAALLISGGPESVYSPAAPKYDPAIFRLEKPILGICYGMQLINYVFGGSVNKKSRREDGPCDITIENTSKIFQKMGKQQHVLMSHGDTVDKVAKGFAVTADSNGLIAGIENPAQKIYGVQFHPEVDLTEHGKDILRNFLFSVVGLKANYTMEDREEKAIQEIHTTVGNKKALVLVSGGVDSTVCAALLTKALPADHIYAVHIDHGFMRLDESKKVKKALEKMGLKIHVVDATETFRHAKTNIKGQETDELQQVTAPEQKRKIIGDTFMRVAQETMNNLKLQPDEVYLVQGTLRPDLIESASTLVSNSANTIKTHHNDTELVRELRMKGRVIEPLKDFHKDEVRALGTRLGLPEELVWRQPFPGPGLAIRTICAEKPYFTKDFSKINAKLQQFSDAETHATLLPIQTVGVQGDGRTYSYLVGLSGEENWEKLMKLAREIPKMIHQANRVVYVFGKKIHSPVKEITETHLREDSISQLQHADDIVNQVLLEYDLLRKLSQVPVISFPVHFGTPGNRSIGIRTFITNDFMTGVPALPGKEIPKAALKKMVSRILKEVPGISRVAYDLTSKPPGTTEWE